MGQENIYYCIGCGTTHQRKDFYKSYNSNHKNGVYPFCKKYIKKESYMEDGSINVKKFKNLLMQMDAPFLESEFKGAVEDKRETIGTYFSRIKTPQNRGYRWKNSMFENNNKTNTEEKNYKNNEIFDLNNFTITQEIIQRWGKKNKKEYIALENFYHSMKDANNIETPQDEFYLKKLSMISLKMDEELENGNYTQVKQLGDLFSKYMADSQFRAIDNTDADKTGGIRNFCSIYTEVEKDGHIPPWEYYRKINGLTQDVLDKTIMHIENFTLRLNNAERMIKPPLDTPKVKPDEINLDVDTDG